MIRLLVADDHRLFRKGIINLLKEYEEIEIAGEAENAAELIKKYFELKPDIILVDISMPDMSGIDAFEEIKEKDSAVKALFLSMYEDEEYIYRIYRSGGKGLVNKNYPEDELLKIIQKVNGGGHFFGDELTDEALLLLIERFDLIGSDSNLSSVDLLSERELEIFKLIGQGHSSNEISEILNISKRTVDHHRERINGKLDADSFQDVIKLAAEYLMQNKAH